MFFFYNNLKEARSLVADCYRGESAIKDAASRFGYLPPRRNEAEEEEKFRGDAKAFTEYRNRLSYATYENFFRATIDDIVGLMQRLAPTVAFDEADDANAPPEVVELNVYGNAQNDGFKGLKRRLNFDQTLYGRYGLLLDVVTDAEGLRPRFCISEYPALSILDGESEGGRVGASRLRWALLDESFLKFDPQTKRRDKIERWRVLGLDANGRYYQALLDGSASAKWTTFNFAEPETTADSVVYPAFKGKTLDFIPFTVCNVDRLGVENWQEPPFADVARVAIANYRVDSIYKRALWNFASPTLIVSNAKKLDGPVSLGGALFLESGTSESAGASLLETSGSGLAELREAKTEIKEALKFTSIRDLLAGAGANASERALALRADSGTATVAAIDLAGGRAMEEQIVFAYVWAGASFEDAARNVKFEPNTSYLGDDFELSSVVQLLTANSAGGSKLLSDRQLYRLIDKAAGGALDSFEDNEEQKIDEEGDAWRQGVAGQAAFDAATQYP